MNNLITVDIGNTNITAGVFKGKSLTVKIKIPTHTYSLYEPYLKKMFAKSGIGRREKINVIVSSVVPVALSRFIMHLNKVADCRITVLGRDIKVPVKNMYRVKSEVGQDRLVNAYAARVLYGAPAVIIDFGTAITFDVVSARGDYLGGLILPGIGISLSSLYEKTALLPKVDLKAAADIIGRDTVNSMRGGILFGFGAMCDGLVAKYRAILGRPVKIIATGGNASLVKRYAHSIRILDEDITLKGLRLIFRNSAPK